MLFRTRFGLRLRAVGENPGAVDTAGVSVVRLRYAAVLIAGLLCGIAGAYLSTGMAAGFIRDMTAGKGFIALAALIFAKWRPWPALGACLLFGLLEAIGDPLPGHHPARHRHGAGAVHAGAALHPDRHHPRGLRRQGDPAEGRRAALRQGAVMEAVETIRARAGAAPVAVGLVLGSGLGHLTGAVDGVAIDYADLPGLPACRRLGPSAEARGRRARGRAGRGPRRPRPLLRARRPGRDARARSRPCAALGAERLILTNAAGSFRADMPPGELMLIADHINFSGRNPLIGEETDARFVNMTDAYDPAMRRSAAATPRPPRTCALGEGVYAWYSGPSFETPAEIRALRSSAPTRSACRRCPR